MPNVFSQEYVLAEEYVEGSPYQPTESYPYLFEKFTKGTAYHKKDPKGNMVLNIENFNIFLCDSKLHYINEDDGQKYECIVNDIDSVVIDYTLFIRYENDIMLEVVEQRKENMLLKRNYVKGVYSVEVERGNTKYRMMNKQYLDKPLRILCQYYLLIEGTIIEAKKTCIENYIGENKKKDFNEFVKLNKIKWKKEDSLVKLLDYFKK